MFPEMDALADVVIDAVKTATDPLLSRIVALEARQPEKGEKGEPGEVGIEGPAGKDATVDMEALAVRAASLIPVPKDGQDAPPVDLDALAMRAAALIPTPKDGINGKDAEVDLDAIVLKVAELMPTPKDGEPGKPGEPGAEGPAGKDAHVDLDALVLKVAELIPTPKDGEPGKPGEPGAEGPAGQDATVDLDELAIKAAALIPVPEDGQNGANGKDADPELVKTIVEDAVAAIPRPQDGKSITVEDVAPLIQELVSDAVQAIPVPKDGDAGATGKDGTGITNALIDSEGMLILTFTDGTMKSIGRVVGERGRDALPAAPGQKGDRGEDGHDGLGFDDISVEHDGERAFTFKFRKGTREKTFGAFSIPAMIYREVWKEGTVYQKGDCVTWAGSLFIAQTATKAKPETSPDWKLAVKRGRDARDK